MAWNSSSEGEESKEEVLRELDRRKKLGEVFVRLEAAKGSRKLVQSFWAKMWCQHLESYQDYESRLPRGRSYLRQGNVYNLEIEPGKISATVTGSHVYEVTVNIEPLPKEQWIEVLAACAGKVGSVLDLLAGKLGDGVLEVINNRENGLFPRPREIRFSCTCPDWADLCKHSAAVLYGVAVRFDSDPSLFFKLRNVDPAELLALGKAEALSGVVGVGDGLEGEDLSALFGIDLAGDGGE